MRPLNRCQTCDLYARPIFKLSIYRDTLSFYFFAQVERQIVPLIFLSKHRVEGIVEFGEGYNFCKMKESGIGI